MRPFEVAPVVSGVGRLGLGRADPTSLAFHSPPGARTLFRPRSSCGLEKFVGKELFLAAPPLPPQHCRSNGALQSRPCAALPGRPLMQGAWDYKTCLGPSGWLTAVVTGSADFRFPRPRSFRKMWKHAWNISDPFLLILTSHSSLGSNSFQSPLGWFLVLKCLDVTKHVFWLLILSQVRYCAARRGQWLLRRVTERRPLIPSEFSKLWLFFLFKN